MCYNSCCPSFVTYQFRKCNRHCDDLCRLIAQLSEVDKNAFFFYMTCSEDPSVFFQGDTSIDLRLLHVLQKAKLLLLLNLPLNMKEVKQSLKIHLRDFPKRLSRSVLQKKKQNHWKEQPLQTIYQVFKSTAS